MKTNEGEIFFFFNLSYSKTVGKLLELSLKTAKILKLGNILNMEHFRKIERIRIHQMYTRKKI